MNRKKIIGKMNGLVVKKISIKVIIMLVICFVFLSVPNDYKAYEVETEIYTEVPASESIYGEDTCISVTSTGEAEFISAVNQERASYGIAPVQTNDFWMKQAMARAGNAAENTVRGVTSGVSHNTDKSYGQDGEGMVGAVISFDPTGPFSSYRGEKKYVPEEYFEEMRGPGWEEFISNLYNYSGDPTTGSQITPGIGGQQIGHYVSMMDPYYKYAADAAAVIDTGCGGTGVWYYATLYSSTPTWGQGTDGEITSSGDVLTSYETDMANGNRISGIDESKLRYNNVSYSMEACASGSNTTINDKYDPAYTGIAQEAAIEQCHENFLDPSFHGTPTLYGTSSSSSSSSTYTSSDAQVVDYSGGETSSSAYETTSGTSAVATDAKGKVNKSNEVEEKKLEDQQEAFEVKKKENDTRREKEALLNDKTHKHRDDESLTTAGKNHFMAMMIWALVISVVYFVGSKLLYLRNK